MYPKKYAHGFCFAVLCCGYTLTDFPISTRFTSLVLWQSNDRPSASKATLMNMDKYFMWIHYERLHNHNKAKHNKTACIFLGDILYSSFGPRAFEVLAPPHELDIGPSFPLWTWITKSSIRGVVKDINFIHFVWSVIPCSPGMLITSFRESIQISLMIIESCNLSGYATPEKLIWSGKDLQEHSAVVQI